MLYCNHQVLYFAPSAPSRARRASPRPPTSHPRTRARMFPPRPGQCAYVIDGAHTEFLVTEYSDHVFVVATQVGKLGTVFQCEPRGEADVDYLLDVDPDARAVAVRMRTLIGKRDDTTLNACARHIGEVLYSRGLQKYVDRQSRTAQKKVSART
jgi:proteasome assembly chaperone 3